MDTGEIAHLLRPFVRLTDGQLAQVSKYLDLLLKWNARVNLTAVRDARQMVTRHFGESFFAADLLVKQHWRGTAIDVGSGAGFPGLPLAVWAPRANITLIESNSKRAAFLNEAIHTLELKNARVFNGRAELFAAEAELVTLRAVEKFESSLRVALRLVQPHGRIGLMIGKGQIELARELGSDFSWEEGTAVPGGHSRVLLVGTRIDKSGNEV